jgi:hypothetical protein
MFLALRQYWALDSIRGWLGLETSSDPIKPS